MYSVDAINKYNKLSNNSNDHDIYINTIRHIINDVYEAKQFCIDNDLISLASCVTRTTKTINMLIRLIENSSRENMEPMIFVFMQLGFGLNLLVINFAKPHEFNYIIEYFEKIHSNMIMISNKQHSSSFSNQDIASSKSELSNEEVEATEDINEIISRIKVLV